jgi:hypothetical protein
MKKGDRSDGRIDRPPSVRESNGGDKTIPLKLFKRKTRDGKYIWHYRGTVAGNRLRGTTDTTDRKIAARLVSEIETRHYKRHLDRPQEVLTFPQAVALYL